MKRVLLAALLSIASMSVFALSSEAPTVSMRLTAESWITANAADVVVDFHAQQSNHSQDLHKATIEALNKAVSSQWHILEWSQSEDKSGLINIDANITARLTNADLNKLSSSLKGLSKPGLNYAISNVVYQPSFDDRQGVLKVLRKDIYQQTRDNLVDLNAALDDQHYSIKTINFAYLEPRIMPLVMMGGSAKHSGNEVPAVSQKMSLVARVEYQLVDNTDA